jgi:hypothetical protein
MTRVAILILTTAFLLAPSIAIAGDQAVDLLPKLLDRLVAPLGQPPGPTPPELLELQRATRVPFLQGPASPTHSYSFKLDPNLGVLVPSTTGSGSVYGLRPSTLGQGHFTFGFNYSHADLQKLDGADLDQLRIGLGDGLVARVSADITQDAFLFQATYGVIDDLDVDITVPLLYQSFVFRGSLESPIGTTTARTSRDVFGIGDILIGAKYRFYNTAPFALAARLELSLPSGNQDDFLGTGTVQVNPSIIASVDLPFRITPHANVGFRFSGDTNKIEHQFFYTVGVEWAAATFLTLGLDFVGVHILDNKRPALREQSGVGFAPLRTASSDIVDVGISFKVNPWKNVLIIGGVLIPLNNTGIRASVIPTLGVEVPF